MAQLRDDIDEDALERDYRQGHLSLRALTAKHGLSGNAIRSRAKTRGWTRGEAQAVRASAFRQANQIAVPTFTGSAPEAIDALGAVGAEVLVKHRTIGSAMTTLLGTLQRQLVEATECEPDLAAAIEEYFEAKAVNAPLMAGVYRQQCNNALHAIGLGARSKTMLNLTTAAAKLIEIERKAWKLDDDDDQRTYEELLAEVLAQK